VCENTVGSYKCINKMHVETKVLRVKDYSEYDNEDDDGDDSDYREQITEVQQNLRCEDGFKRNENLECVGKPIIIRLFCWNKIKYTNS